MQDIKRIGVVGSGKMGCGIAQVCSQSGYTVVMTDKEEKIVDNSIEKIRKHITRLSQKGEIDQQQKDKILSRIKGTTEISSLSHCDLVIEAVFEDVDIKKTVLEELDHICSKETIIASNTSSLSISKLASGLSRMEKIVGMHFFNPVPLMALVEIVKTVKTSLQVIHHVVEFAKSINKKPVVVQDQAGFVVNKILTPFLFDAVKTLSEGVCTVKEIDNSMRYGCGHPMGPLALCDLIGLDILVNAGNAMFEEYHENKYAPPPLLKRLVEIGDYGIKSGCGFYVYENKEQPKPRAFS